MPKWLKLILAILLFPICAGAAMALWKVLRASGSAELIWVPAFAGAACWVVVYLLLPKPMLLYVFGHELTHAIWTWFFGGQVRKFKASSKGGHVVVTRNNFLIALAPYFFPLYAILVVLFFMAGHHLWNWRNYLPWFHLLLGAAYSFHVTLTWHILKHSQTDISEQGYIFSAVVIFLGNVTVLLLGIPLLIDGVGIPTAFIWWFESTREFIYQLSRAFL